MEKRGKNFIVVVIVALFLGLAGFNPAAADGIVGASNGTTVKAGTNAVTEVVDAQSITITGGALSTDFAVSQDHNAWTGYGTPQLAQKGGCDEAKARAGDPTFAGRAITVNGSAFTDYDTCLKSLTSGAAANGTPATGSSSADCSSPVSSTGDTVQESDDAVCVKSGEWVVVRVTNASNGTIKISVTQLTKDTAYPGIKGQKATHVWWNYGSPAMAYVGGCSEAKARSGEATGDDASLWDWGYAVSLNGKDVPTTSCKSWAADQK
jgi:hypothetical protein